MAQSVDYPITNGTVVRESDGVKLWPPPATMDPFERELRAAFEEMTLLLVAKRKSYGPNNLIRFGAMGIVIRASDKIDRLANMLKAGETASADGDSIEDAFRDLCGYGILGLLYLRDKLANP